MSRQHWIDEFFRKRLEKRTFPVEKGEFEDMRALLQVHNGTTRLIRGGRFSKWWLSALIPVAGLLWWASAADSTDDRDPQTASVSSSTENGHSGSNPSRVVPNGGGTAATSTTEEASIHDPANSPSENAIDKDNDLVNGRSSGLDDSTTPNSANEDQSSATGSGSGGTTWKERGGSSMASERSQGSNGPASLSNPAVAQERTRLKGTSASLAPHESDGRRKLRTNVRAGASLVDPTTEPNTRAALQKNLGASSATDLADAPTTTPEHDHILLPSKALNDGPGSLAEAAPIDHVTLTGDPADDPMSAAENTFVGLPGQRMSDENLASSAEKDLVPAQQHAPISPETPDRASGLEALEGLPARTPDHADVSTGEVISREIEVLETMAVVVPRYMQPAPAATRQPLDRSLEVIKFLSAGELHAFGAPLNVRTRKSDGVNWGPEMGSLFGFEYRVRVKRFTWSTGILYGSYAIRMDQGDTDVRLGFVEIPLLGSYKLLRGRFGVVLQGGLTADLLFNSSGRYPVEQDRRSVGFPEDAFRTANYSWLLRPQATYNLNEHLTISAGPLWKAQLGEVAQTGPLDGARISSSGISIGLSWRLERTTF